MTRPPPSQTASRSVLRRYAVAFLAAGSLAAAQRSSCLERIDLEPAGIGRPTDLMGRSVALVGDTAAVGAPESQINGVNSGTVDIYRLQQGTWQFEAMLSPSDPSPNQLFGNAVALAPDLLVAGFNPLYTFERNGTTWQQVDEMPGTGAQQIGISGNTLVAGDTIYVRAGSGWQVQAVMQPSSDQEVFAAAAIDGDLIVASTRGISTFSPPGSVYFYSRSGTSWMSEGVVPQASSYYAAPVALSGSTALFSSPNLGDTTIVRVFDRDSSGNWVDHGTLDAGTDFTFDVPVSIDGDTALVGAHSDFTAYTFVRSGGVWSRDQHFNDPDAYCFASVALSGSTALAGCPNSYTASGGFGTAAIFSLDTRPPTVIGEFGQGDAHADEEFGWQVAAAGNSFLAASMSGVYFYDNGTKGWMQTNAFPNPPTNTLAASAVLDGDTAAIGYPVQIYPGGTSEVDVYSRSSGTWALQASILGPPQSGSPPVFANALALQDDVLVVGDFDFSSSVCHVFHRSGSAWQAEADIQPTGSSPGDYFCWSLSMSGDTLLVGAPKADSGIETDAGEAYVFVRSGSTWVQQQQLFAPLIATGAGFGTSVAIVGNTAVIGSNNDTAGKSTRGEVNVYRRSGTTWSWQATLMPPGPGNAPGDYGFAVAVSDAEDRILATAPYDPSHDPYAGVAFAFAFDGTQWSPTATIHAEPPFPPTTNDLFGQSVAFSGEQFVIGAPQDGVGGAVYVGATSEAIFSNGFDPTSP